MDGRRCGGAGRSGGVAWSRDVSEQFPCLALAGRSCPTCFSFPILHFKPWEHCAAQQRFGEEEHLIAQKVKSKIVELLFFC